MLLTYLFGIILLFEGMCEDELDESRDDDDNFRLRINLLADFKFCKRDDFIFLFDLSLEREDSDEDADSLESHILLQIFRRLSLRFFILLLRVTG